VVFTWKTKDGIKDVRCIKIFFEIMDSLEQKREKYFDKYGLVPEFKGGVHTGNVITAKIGDLKRVIVYNGDVMNTTSRIQEMCNHYHCKLLISGKLLEKLALGKTYSSTFMESVNLRGKKKKVRLYCIERKTTNG
jgi:adenylate cyclase